MRDYAKEFTLVEMLVVMTIMVLLYGITAVALLPAQSKQELDGAARELQATLLQARGLAARYNAVYSVVFHNAGSKGSWGASSEYHPGNSIESNAGRYLWQVSKCTGSVGGNTGFSGTTAGAPGGVLHDFTGPGSYAGSVVDREVKWVMTSNGSYSRSGGGVWYQIAGPYPATGRFPTVNDPCVEGATIEEKLNHVASVFGTVRIGRKHRLPDGIRLNMGKNWTAVKYTGSGEKVAFGKYGDLRVMFLPTGRAVFCPGEFAGTNKDTDADDSTVAFVLIRAGYDSAAAVLRYAPKLVVSVNKFTGLPEVRGYKQGEDPALTND